MAIDDSELLWPLVFNIVAAQRGRPHPRLDEVLRRDPTVGLPPDVRRALVETAAARDDRIRVGRASSAVPSETGGGIFNWYEWTDLPPLEPDPYPEQSLGRGVTQADLHRFCLDHGLLPTWKGDEH